MLVKIPTLRTPEAFRQHCRNLGIEIPCDDTILTGTASPLTTSPAPPVRLNGRVPANRWVVQPMEGWDGTSTGGVTEEVRRRWRRFGETGAKILFGGEAMAVRPDGRANPNQLLLTAGNAEEIRGLIQLARASHRAAHGTDEDLVVGLQLTHSGRFCRPNDPGRWEPRVAYRHPLLDARFHVTREDQVLSDEEVKELIGDYVQAACVARAVGADFIDLKHCHGYLLHEFLGAHTRPGPYGGSFENRTRILREIVEGIRRSGNPIDIAVRLSAFDMIPFRKSPAGEAWSGLPDAGTPEPWDPAHPYHYGFGLDPNSPTTPDLSEPKRFLELCGTLGIRLVNLSAGSPYYTPHLLRPAAYPPSDGYPPPEDPLVGVARQMAAVRELRASTRGDLALIGSGYTYLQEFLPHVAQAAIRAGWVDFVGLGRMVLSYPGILADATTKGAIASRGICRTFSDCTTAPRNGLPSGCYPLDPHYAAKPEAARLKEIRSRRPKP